MLDLALVPFVGSKLVFEMTGGCCCCCCLAASGFLCGSFLPCGLRADWSLAVGVSYVRALKKGNNDTKLKTMRTMLT